MWYHCAISLCIIVSFVDAKNEEYMGYKVYNVKFENQNQADRLYELKGDMVDFWRKPSLKYDVTGRAMVSPAQTDWFEERLADLNIKKDIFIDDVYEHLTKTERTRSTRNNTEGVFDFNGYYRYDDILNHLNTLQEAYSNTSISVTIEEFGRTEQNRPIVYLRISHNSNETIDEEKPVVIIESGIIPRDWITIPASLNVVNRLLENQTQFLTRADWIIVPVVNPDGYEYTHTNLRLWSKSMSTRSNLGFICPGVNINRNFDIDWLVSDSSSSPCSHLYAGTDPFSEVESQLIQYLIDTYNERIRLYISLQNNGGFVSYPWQYERAASGMFRQHLLLGLDMIEAMNDEYRLDVGWSALGDRASGTASDYVQQSGVLYSLNIGVVERGDDGVNVPEGEIVDVIEDVWRAVSVAASTVL